MGQVTGRAWKKAFATNQDQTAFASKVATVTKPSNDGVIDLTKDGIVYPRFMRFIPYGLGSADDTFSLRIWGWARVHASDPKKTLWVPTPIGEFACTISTAVGVAGSPVLDTERFADTIAPVALMLGDIKIAAGTSVNSETKVLTPANNTPAHVELPLDGWEMIEFDSDQTNATVPTVNVLYALVG